MKIGTCQYEHNEVSEGSNGRERSDVLSRTSSACRIDQVEKQLFERDKEQVHLNGSCEWFSIIFFRCLS
jgi:hypothetical protein